jgi:hypothetical protein
MRQSIWLAGTGRSGTTWFGNLLAGIGRSAMIFEPLHPQRVRLPADLDPRLSAPYDRPYLRPDADAPEWERYIRGLVDGRHLTPWMRFALRRKKAWPGVMWDFLKADRYVIKAIRGNLLEGWIRTRIRVPVVHMIRHPCATVLSQRKAGWGHDLSTFLNSAPLVTDHLRSQVEFLNGLTNVTQRMAARWAIDNVVPLRQAAAHDILVMTYEEAVLDPRRAVTRVAEYAGWSISEPDLRRIDARAGQPISGLREVASAEAMLGKWRKHATDEDVRDILDTTRRLGITLYNEEPVPTHASEAHAVD